MSLLKNPFAIRDGKVVVIDDLHANESGLACNCRCPNCGGEFEAKMGDIRIHHFSHSKNACDDDKAFIAGLYKLYKQFLDEGNCIFLPKIILYCDLGRVEHITEENQKFYISKYKNSRTNHKMVINPDGKFKPDNSEIVYDSKNKPQAIITSKGNKKLALVIQYPKIGCYTHIVSQYKDIPSLKLNLYDINDVRIKNTDLLYKLFYSCSLYSWFTESIIMYKLPKIDKLNKEKYDELYEKKQEELAIKNIAEDVERSNYIEHCRNDRYYYYREAQKSRNDTTYKDFDRYSKFRSKDDFELFEKAKERQKYIEKKKSESEKLKIETDKRIKARREQRERQFLPLKNYIKKYYADNRLGKPNTDDIYELYKFTEKFPDAENTLGKLEAELCIKKGMPPIDHWGHVWMSCIRCGTLYKVVLRKNESVPTEYVGTCDECLKSQF